MIDEAFAALLAVGEDVEADVLLLAQRDDGGVVLRLAQRLALEPKHGAAAIGRGEPGGPRKAADGRGRERWKLHGLDRGAGRQ